MFAKSTSKAIVALCLGLALAAAASPASARVQHRHAHPEPHTKINSGWGPPMTWDEIEISHPEGGG